MHVALSRAGFPAYEATLVYLHLSLEDNLYTTCHLQHTSRIYRELMGGENSPLIRYLAILRRRCLNRPQSDLPSGGLQAKCAQW